MSLDFLQSLRNRGLRVVDGEGPRPAKLAIIGEALGENEVIQGRPFATIPQGADWHPTAGWFLDKCLKVAGIDRREVWVDNVIPIRPPDNDLSRLTELSLQTSDFILPLYERLKFVNPTCILALGGLSASVLTAGLGTGITNTRGSILRCSLQPPLRNASDFLPPEPIYPPWKVVPSFHPAGIMRLGDTTAKQDLAGEKGLKYDYGASRVSLICDCIRAKKESTNGLPPVSLSDFDLHISPSFRGTLEYLDFLRSCPFIAFDIETAGHEITYLGFSGDGRGAISFLVSSFSQHEMVEVKKQVADLFWTHEGLIAQNGTFDITYLMPWAPVRKLHFDTMLAHHLLYSELPHSLAFLASIYTRIPFHLVGHSLEPAQYNCIHAIATWQIAMELKKEMDETI